MESIPSPISLIPAPDTIRRELAEVNKQANFLRRLLRLALSAQQAATTEPIDIRQEAPRA